MVAENTKRKREQVVVAITGASGVVYALRLIECLLKAERQVIVLLSKPGQVVVAMETTLNLPSRAKDIQAVLSQHFAVNRDQLLVYGKDQWTAPIASGSGVPHAMVVCPCTTGTLSAIACGASNNLIERAADVVLKEQRKLILVPRETPFSVIHLENMLKLARMGALILPPNPGFYHNPSTIEDLVDFVVARILDQLSIEQKISARWGEEG